MNGAAHLSTEPTASRGPSRLRVEGSPLVPQVRSRAVVAEEAARRWARRLPLRDFAFALPAPGGWPEEGAAGAQVRGALALSADRAVLLSVIALSAPGGWPNEGAAGAQG